MREKIIKITFLVVAMINYNTKATSTPIKNSTSKAIVPAISKTSSTVNPIRITSWRMNRGGGIIDMDYPANGHGDVRAYNLMNIPDKNNSDWENAPLDNNGDVSFAEVSNLDPADCRKKLDFTYFETEIDIPVGTVLTELKVTFSKVDDGARAYIFNSDNPNGAFVGQIKLRQDPVTEDYSSLAKIGEVNRLVIVQFDDCWRENNLKRAKVIANGEEIEIDTEPEALDDVYTVSENSVETSFDILTNDSFGSNGSRDGNPISLFGFYTGNGGELHILGNTVTYTPRSGFTGSDSFRYLITDSDGDSSQATVNITVTEQDTPTAEDDSVTGTQNTLLVIDVLDNDRFGADGPNATTPLSISSSTTSQGGSVLVSNGKIEYTSLTGFNGQDTFSYTIKDGDDDTANATVTIDVETSASPNDRLRARPDTFSVNQNSTDNDLNVLVDNGSGADSFGSNGAIDNGLTFPNGTLAGNSDKGGTLSVNQNGTASPLDDFFVYTPKTNFIGEDQFKYMITDANGATSIAIVFITVTESSVPNAQDDAVTVVQDSGVNLIDILVNDTFGAAGQATTGSVTLDTTGTTGVATLNGDNKVEYTPADGSSDPDSFSYTITDLNGATDTATVTITVSGVDPNGGPTAQDDDVTVTQDSQDNPISILIDNGNGVDSYGINGAHPTYPISLSAFYTDNGGQLVLNGEVVTYTPRPGFNGPDSFGYTLTDANGNADTATVSITVSQTATPTANDDTIAVQENSGLISIDVLANDTFGADGAGNPSITVPSGSSSEGGTIAVNAGKVDYTPAVDFNGLDSFTYTIRDVDGDESTATVLITVTIEDVSNPTLQPTALSDVVTAVQNSTGNSINVFADNGSGADSFGSSGPIDNGLTFPNGTLIGNSDFGGTVSIAQNSTASTLDDTVVYAPKTNFIGEDQFKYMITDANGATSIAIVFITVTESSVPNAQDDAVTVVQDSGVNLIDILVNDTFGAAGQATTGSVTLDTTGTTGVATLNGDNKVEYTPASGSSASDSFSYTITDLNGATDTATVTITVSGVDPNGGPTAQDDDVTVTQDSQDNPISILIDNGNGVDSYGINGAHPTYPISLSGTFTDNGGQLVLNGEVVTYTPRPGFHGLDSFGYTLTDANGNADTATVSITVSQTATPTANDDSASTEQDTPIVIDVLANDTFGADGAGDPSITLPSGSSSEGGTIAVNAGKIDYNPALGYSGTDTFTYTIEDGSGDIATATVTVVVAEAGAVDSVPVAKDDAVTVTENTTDNVIDILADNGFGVDEFGLDGANPNHPISLSGTFTDNGGELTLDGNSVKYTPRANYRGEDNFSYTITDSNGDADTAAVTITVVPAVPKTGDTKTSFGGVSFGNDFTAYPNPSTGYVKTTVFSTTNTEAEVLLFDITGKVILRKQTSLTIGKNELELNLNIKSGIMLLRVQSPQTNYGTTKIVFK